MKPLVKNKYLLERFQAKGGWTYARIPEIEPDKKAHFGWRKVKGTIDGYPISQYHLMPMGNGQLFLPVKAEIRKKIGKKEGDYVEVVLYPDNDPLEIPRELLECLEVEPGAHQFFMSLSDSEKKLYIRWIYEAKTEKTMVKRMASCINNLLEGRKFGEKAW
jgi:bifunctional DNA-binding transcriptional regulator/antitoxin component of YhaV-PrlF toxin-antitoxin module